MNSFDEFKRTIGLLRQCEESVRLDEFAEWIAAFDCDLSQQGMDLNLARSQLLEAHTRLALIDPLFKSLGWKLTLRPDFCFCDLPTAAIEVPVTPGLKRRWMDYLGFEDAGAMHRPRLMIEAKRYRLKLPVEDRRSPPERHPFCKTISDFARGQMPEKTATEWLGYLNDHFEYLRGLEKQNGRLNVSAITNGVWLVIITDPHQLLSPSTADKADILCFDTLEIVGRHASLVYQRLSRHTLCPGADLVRIEDVSDVLNPLNVEGISFAIVVTYDENIGPYKRSPCVKVAPLVGLVGTNGSVTFCRSDNNNEYVAPVSSTDFDSLRSEQEQLQRRLQTRFGMNWRRLNLPELIKKNVAVKTNTTRSRALEKEWRFLTGDQPWIFGDLAAADCCAHKHQPTEDWHDTRLDRQPSINPLTMFPAGHTSQCRHRDVKDIRHRKPIASDSGTLLKHSPLCWLYDLEQFGCCQNCVFLTHCPATRDVTLPCDANGLEIGHSGR